MWGFNMFVIVCWFGSICVTSFSWKISSEIFPKYCQFVWSLNQWGFAAVSLEYLSTVTALLASLGTEKVCSLNLLIIHNICFWSGQIAQLLQWRWISMFCYELLKRLLYSQTLLWSGRDVISPMFVNLCINKWEDSNWFSVLGKVVVL